MKIVFSVVLALVLGLSTPLVVARSAVVQAPQTIALIGSDGAPLDEARTRAAIVTGAARKGWAVQQETPGRIELRVDVRGKHAVVVAAVYSAGQVRFDYVDSTNMNYRMRASGTWAIHPKYMTWRSMLEQSVLDAATGS